MEYYDFSKETEHFPIYEIFDSIFNGNELGELMSKLKINEKKFSDSKIFNKIKKVNLKYTDTKKIKDIL